MWSVKNSPLSFIICVPFNCFWTPKYWPLSPGIGSLGTSHQSCDFGEWGPGSPDLNCQLFLHWQNKFCKGKPIPWTLYTKGFFGLGYGNAPVLICDSKA